MRLPVTTAAVTATAAMAADTAKAAAAAAASAASTVAGMTIVAIYSSASSFSRRQRRLPPTRAELAGKGLRYGETFNTERQYMALYKGGVTQPRRTKSGGTIPSLVLGTRLPEHHLRLRSGWWCDDC